MEGLHLERFLREALLFSGLDADQLSTIARSMTVKRFLPEEHLITEGHDSYHGGMGVVLRGRLLVVRGRDEILARLGPGEIFGEMSLIDDEPRSATVVAEEPSAVALLYRGAFRSILMEHPAVSLRLLAILCKRLRDVGDAPTSALS